MKRISVRNNACTVCEFMYVFGTDGRPAPFAVARMRFVDQPAGGQPRKSPADMSTSGVYFGFWRKRDVFIQRIHGTPADGVPECF